MPNKLIKDLIDEGAVILKEQGYSIRSSEYTLLTWRQFQGFCNKKGYETYLPFYRSDRHGDAPHNVLYTRNCDRIPECFIA